MTFLDIKKLVLSQMGEDTDELALAEYGTLLDAYINEAYMNICRHKKQKYDEQVVGFVDKRAHISAISKNAVVFIKIFGQAQTNVCYETIADMLFINGAVDGDYTVCFLYLPEHLVADTDEPDLALQDCYLMADFATYRGLALGNPTRQKRSEFFLMRYLSGYSAMGANKTQITNKY